MESFLKSILITALLCVFIVRPEFLEVLNDHFILIKRAILYPENQEALLLFWI